MSKTRDEGSDHGEGTTLAQMATSASTVLHSRLEEAPYRTLGIALGLGVVLGGGMWRLLGRALVSLSARAFVATLDPNIGHQRSSQEARP